MNADLIVTGNIYNGKNNSKTLSMLAIKDGYYCYVGSKDKLKEYQGEHTAVIHCKDGSVVPGLVEGHAHVTSGTHLIRGVDLHGLKSPSEYVEAIKNYVERFPEEEFIIGRGFINSHFGQEGPTAKLLDDISLEKYIILDSEDCHSSWVNRRVLLSAGITKGTKEVENGVIVRYEGTNEPTGWLKEKEMDRVEKLLPSTTLEEYKEVILRYQELALSQGLTAVYEPVMNDKLDLKIRIQAYAELDKEKRLHMQFRGGVTLNPNEEPDMLDQIAEWRQQTKGTHFELLGIKVFLDGVVEGHTAFLREDYADHPGDHGYNMWDQEKLNAIFVKAAELDFSVHVHAIGDGAVDSALEAFEAARQNCGKKDLRNCITHLQVVAEDQIKKMKELDIIAVTNPFWHYKNPAYYDDLEVPYLGRARAEKEYPLKAFFDENIVVTQASDWPVSYSFHPFLGMEIAVTRREGGNVTMEPLNEKEAVTIQQMLAAASVNGAYQLSLEKELGSIEAGKKGNFIILDKDIGNMPAEQIAEMTVLYNYINGVRVFEKE